MIRVEVGEVVVLTAREEGLAFGAGKNISAVGGMVEVFLVIELVILTLPVLDFNQDINRLLVTASTLRGW